MIEGADWLCDKHFGKRLIDEGVEILDPATGTGTYICELIEFFRGQPDKLRHKYTEELHANEVAILPYYVANLNIEATYQSVLGEFTEYPNLCFVDTLDNIGGLGQSSETTPDLFASFSSENVERVNRQNRRKISVIIGNPPYNANQQNENDNNKNRTYPFVDELIKSSYVHLSTAQKTKVYDMYARFFRWASDRLIDDGIISFITNRSFIDSRTFDGFRRHIGLNFAEVYLVDLGGDVRANPKLSGTKHNVFGIQTGVAIAFLVRKKNISECTMHYSRRPEMETAEDKLAWLGVVKPWDTKFEVVVPDKHANWINQTENDWEDLLPIADKKTKAAKTSTQDRSIFKSFVSGIKTNRDNWSYDWSVRGLEEKYDFFASRFKQQKTETFDTSIKWSRDLKNKWRANVTLPKRPKIATSMWRPFVTKKFLWIKPVNDIFYNEHLKIFGHSGSRKVHFISISGTSAAKPFQALAGDIPRDYEAIEKNNILPRSLVGPEGEELDNVTDWAVRKFTKHYGSKTKITKDDIFAYVYAVLHDPIYRETYAINLKREFPRIPFYPDFHQWRDWGQTLLDLHIGYENVRPWKLKRIDTEDVKAKKAGLSPKPKLKAEKDTGQIILDSETTLSGIPPECWDYKLGNRSGLEWILDQYKEKKPRDPTVAEKFNTYRFADYKEHVIDLIKRVTRVSVETMAITEAMKGIKRESDTTKAP